MSLHRRRLWSWSVLAGLTALGAAWLAHVDFNRKVTSNVLDLVPEDEREPETVLVRELASQEEARVMLFSLTQADGSPAPSEAARRFATELQRSPVFAEAEALQDIGSNDALGRELFARRFTLLFPQWLHSRESDFAATGKPTADFSEWLATDTVARLDRFLERPEALALSDLVPADPMLLVPGVIERLAAGPVTSAARPGLVWAQLAVSPLLAEGQAPAFAAIADATAALQSEYPGVTVADTGVNRFAAASRARIEHDLTWLNGLSLAAVLAVALTFIPVVWRGLHLVPALLFSVLTAWVTVTAVFERVHLLVFVVGSLLVGVAIDYGFYLFVQPPSVPDEDYWSKVNRLQKPLLASCLTTVAGFALLLFSDLPVIRQLGVYVGSGLLGALGGAVLYFSTVRDPYLETRSFRGGRALAPGARRWLWGLLVAAWCLALPGLFRLSWRDDIRDLEIPTPGLLQQDQRIRALFGEGGSRTVYLTSAANLEEARTALDRFDTWLNAAGGRAAGTNLGLVVPTSVESEEAAQFFGTHPEFPDRLRSELTRTGYAPDAFEPFFDAYAGQAGKVADGSADQSVAAALSPLESVLPGPLRLLVHRGTPMSWFVTVVSQAPEVPPPGDTQTVTVSELQSLNRVFSRYRRSALGLSAVGLALVGLGVLLTYGLRDGIRIFAIPCGACLGVFGIYGWLGLPLNLFHLLGAFLGVCLTHNYSIFTATSAYRREPPPVSVRLSALSTAASFGVLALSGIPVVRALGITVASMVVMSLLLIEFEHLGPLAAKR